MTETTATLRITRFFSKTLGYTCLMLLAILAFGEIIFRLPSVTMRLPAPALFDGYRAPETQLPELDKYIEAHGAVDCVFIGNSKVKTGLIPQVFETAYKAQTGKTIQCYNLGLDGLTASSIGAVGQLLNKNYHPQLVIYGTGPTEYITTAHTNYSQDNFPNSPYTQYLLGNFNIQGWLMNVSAIYRYWSSVPSALSRIVEKVGWKQAKNAGNPRITPANLFENDKALPQAETRHEQGFAPLVSFSFPQNLTEQPPNLNLMTFDQQDFDGFRQLVDMAGTGAFHLIIVAVPQQRQNDLFDRTGHPEKMLDTVVASYARKHGVPFWSTHTLKLIPPTAWADTVHMHISGALLFSSWLGTQVGEAANQGILGTSIPAELISSPPIDKVDITAPYIATDGMGKTNYQLYTSYRTAFRLYPSDAAILDVNPSPFGPTFLKNVAGLYVEWATGISQDRRNECFNLLITFDRMRSRDDSTVTSQQKQSLDRWYSSYTPGDLQAAGFRYLVYRNEDWNSSSAIPATIQFSTSYHLVARWHYSPLDETYYLYELASK